MNLYEKQVRASELTGGGIGGPFPKGTPNWNRRFRENLTKCGLVLIENEAPPAHENWIVAPLPDPDDPNDRWPTGSYILEAAE